MRRDDPDEADRAGERHRSAGRDSGSGDDRDAGAADVEAMRGGSGLAKRE